MNLNKVFLVGRLTRDPQLRYTPSGSAVADVGLAVNRVFTDASGQKREETCFVDVVLWKKQAETCARYLHKGNPIFIEGRLNYESWEGNDGQKRTRLRVVADNFQFVDTPGDRRGREGAESGTAGPPASAVPPPPPVEGPPPEMVEEPANDIPF
jgi:single-strand DNA-binding protein